MRAVQMGGWNRSRDIVTLKTGGIGEYMDASTRLGGRACAVRAYGHLSHHDTSMGESFGRLTLKRDDKRNLEGVSVYRAYGQQHSQASARGK